MKIIYAAPLLLLAFCLNTSDAKADIIIEVTGLPGSGLTQWTFAGSSIAQAALAIQNNDLGSSSVNRWNHSNGELFGGEIYSDANFNDTVLFFTSSSATASGAGVGGSSIGIDGLYLDSDGSSGGDDWGWVPSTSFNSVLSGAINYSESAILNRDITTFGEGANAIAMLGDSFTVTSTSETIGGFRASFSASAVPEPSSTTLVLGVIGLCTIVRRRFSPNT